MMRHITMVPVMALLSVMLLTGCWVQSLYPFYTDQTRIAIPAHIVGQWVLTDEEGDDQGSKPWSFSEGKIHSHYKGVEMSSEAVFFKVDDVLFVDVEGGESVFVKGDDLEDIWLNAHRHSVHQVYKVETTDNEMTLLPLDIDWVLKQIESGAVKLSYYRPAPKSENEDNKNPIILTENSEGLTHFLKYCITKPAAFKGEEVIRYTFRKVEKK